ncbi:hypothetical protein FB382_001317 [Nocardioides ginsengisegetis]|uniref:Ig-like domain-containing protein n=1 Tax=Nocardioides ginsengisegetis TaxID=661491 RepID=A0A7W3IYN1_9ACTN|nr:PxKF domain-containing protein [Nocardioides ginsengisegetis]MBA8803026.1 hypothetical protein [Nocardioides ginsengisegetis]
MCEATLDKGYRPGAGHRWWLKVLASLALVLGSIGVIPTATANTVLTAGFTGGANTVNLGGTLYAKQNAALTLTVTTDSSKCVEVYNGSNALVDSKTDNSGLTGWTFSGAAWTAGAGNGLQAFTVKAYSAKNCKTNPNETMAVQTASYVLDNAAPTATATLNPAPNGAGWNKADTTVTWTASDNGGSGVANVSPTTSTVSTEGTTTRTTTVTDNLGNSATSAPVTVKVDKTAPTITGSRSPAPNANGWNNSDVTVSFSPSDATSGVKAATSPVVLSSNGAGQSVTGSVTDNADNTASTTVSGINIDKVAPTLIGHPTTSPNANGWYAGDVAVAWTATDALSGVTTSPGNSTISGEGTGLTAAQSVTDRAGNTSGSVQSTPAVRIDRTAPTTSLTAPPAWSPTDLTLTLVANDGLSGVDRTRFELDGGPTATGTSVPVTTEGTHTLSFWSVDKAGNTETAHQVTFGIDKSAPTIAHLQSPPANSDGWNNTSVTVTFSCADQDNLSGVASCTGPQTVTTEGPAQAVNGTAIDRAGNSATDHATVSIDKTPPTITVDALPAPNASGWYRAPVTATFTAADTLSGIKLADKSHVFGEGGAQLFAAGATDVAGNSSSVVTPLVSVDTTPPTITGTVVDTPNADGWFSDDVTVHWTCHDNLSGVVTCPGDTVVHGEGSDRSASASITDRAGNTVTATVDGIRIDRTAPTTDAAGVPAGWVNAPVTVGLGASDNLSDVASTWYAVDGGTAASGTSVTVGAEGVHLVRYWSVDHAGNTETARMFTVRLDLTSPSITPGQSPAPNANGWNNTDVAVSFACEDQTNLSGLDECTAPSVVSTEGLAQRVAGSASDHAGNRVTGSAAINIDKTPPAITGAPDRAANAAGWYADDVTVSFKATDGLSGIDQVTQPRRLSEGADQRVDGSATDNAGNSAATSVTGINVDETAPDLSAAPTTLPNAHGWYNTPVTEVWAASDTLSGLAGPVPPAAVLSSDGEGQTVSASVTDKAGNTTSATSEPVKIDRTAPWTDASSPGGWTNHGVTVTLTPHDGLSGVASTSYRVDGGAAHVGTSVVLEDEGTHTVAYASTDVAGNTEDVQSVTVKIDKTAPTITHALTPPANGNGWNNTDVTVTFTCDDQVGLSGVASCSDPSDVTDEGAGQEVTGTATDNAGNGASDTARVSLDRTKPTITGHRSPVANAYGWNNTDVTVHFDAHDQLSGLDGVTADQTLSEGTDQSVTGTARDAAGNESSDTVSGVNVDEAAPTLSGEPTTAPNAHGWYAGDVTIHWTADDDRSGIPVPPGNDTITGEGEALRAGATVTDRAGNSTSAQSPAVKIDRTAPTTGADAPAGWNNSAVTVSLSAADGLSGVEGTYYAVDGGTSHQGSSLTLSTEGVHTLTYWSVDNAGNTEPAHTVTVKIDLTDPTIGHEVRPAPNAAGWNNGPVKVHFGCDDALSGVATCSPDEPVTTDGKDQPVQGAATDNAGNRRTDSALVSIDTVDPTITGGPDRAPNANGWYDGDVTVGFTCDDALSGIADCTAPVVVGEGAGQRVHGTATDAADNEDDLVVGPLEVDKTAPSLSGAVTSQPNADGWYRGDVTVAWTASDALSGLDGPAPADSTITSEGRDLVAGATVRDRAGNQTSATSHPVRIDRTAPVTTVSDVSDWTNSAVTVDLSAGDTLSGVEGTYYVVDGGDTVEGDRVVLDSEGVHTVQVWSLDHAGNVEQRHTVTVKIDRTLPGISHSLSPQPNASGWNNSDVTVTFTCTDADSGMAGCTTPVTRGEGAAQHVVGIATDRAGNRATDEATVSVDETAPKVTGELSARPNAHGWFNADVVATFSCADQAGLSGVVSCPDGVTFGEGRGQSAGGAATDGADNTGAPFRITGVDVDKTRPDLTGRATTPPNANGWYAGDVTVRWTATDALSGVDGSGPADSTVTGEGDDLSTSASVSDLAGNSRSVTVRGLKIDRTAPSTSATPPNGWQSSDVTLRLTASDSLSGVAVTRYSVDGGPTQDGTAVSVSREGTHRVAFWSVDNAGNREETATVTVLVDKTPPGITGRATTSPNAAGWYRTPVTVAFTCSDGTSGIAACQPDVTTSAQGSNSVTGSAVDNAGNTARATVGPLNVDTVAPTVRLGGVSDGMTYTLGAVPAATVSGSDSTSGLAAPATMTTTGGTSSGVGTFTVTGRAVDRAGNEGSATLTYRVIYGYGTQLFLQPVNDTAHQTGLSTSVFNAGQAIPMKFLVRNAAGQVVRTAAAPQWLTPVKGGPTSAAVNEGAYTTTGTVGSTYTWDGSQYQYNWKTEKTQAGSYWRVGVALDDGQTYYVNIGLR